MNADFYLTLQLKGTTEEICSMLKIVNKYVFKGEKDTYFNLTKVNDKFVEDPNGKFIYARYNNESIGDIFATYRTDHICAADIYGIALVAYAKELDNIKNMSDDELFRFVYDVPSDLYAFTPNRKYLQEMATEKYFDKQNFVPKVPAATPVAMASMPLLPGNFLAKKSVNSR